MSPRTDPERDTRLLASVDEATARMLFPERFQGPVSVTLAYPAFEGELAQQAGELEAAAEVERDEAVTTGATPRVRATFHVDQVEQLHALYSFVEAHAERAQVDVLLDGKRVPMIRELWLPLLWNLRA